MSSVPEPLRLSGSIPVLHGVLSASFHLGYAQPDDDDRIGAAMEEISDWIGEHLTWTWSSLVGVAEPFRRADLGYFAHYPSSLPIFDVTGAPPDVAKELVAIEASRRMGLEIQVKGGEGRAPASPFSLEMLADVVGFSPTEGLLAPAALKITVPASWPLDDFERRVRRIAAALPLRWGAAGLGYASWGALHYEEAEQGLYAHARRYPGYDVGFAATFLDDFVDRVRTVSWLTFLGPDLVDEVARVRKAPLASTSLVTVDVLGEATVLRAGERPEAGDLNRLEIPPAYAQADALIRPVRAARGLDFLESWNDRTTETWLRRFERARG